MTQTLQRAAFSASSRLTFLTRTSLCAVTLAYGWTALILASLIANNVEFINSNAHDRKAMRSFIISEFCKYTAHDADCSASYAQRVIVKGILPDALATLTDLLIDDAIEFGASQVEAA